MNSLQAPAADSTTEARPEPVVDEEVPLGWECANPALQIERWNEDAIAVVEWR